MAPGHPRTVVVWDTSIASRNLGDTIIMDAVQTVVRELFPTAMILRIPTHDSIGDYSLSLVEGASYSIVGGTNLLSSNFDTYNQWKIGRREMKRLRNVVLLGVGWWQYQDPPNRFTRKLLGSILHADMVHSVRDSYTRSHLNHVGLSNVVNTGCVTLWPITDEVLRNTPDEKGGECIVTLTDYNPIPHLDQALLDTVLAAYGRVSFWPQGAGDLSYLHRIRGERQIEVLAPDVAALDRALLESASIDFVGTRLHGGIRAMQKARRTVILAIDNRATEMGKDFGLPVAARDDIQSLAQRIEARVAPALKLPYAEIAKWKRQFGVASE